MGPMHAAQHFLSKIDSRARHIPLKVQVTLHGSLAATGDGHGTPGAVTAGLMGYHYETVTLPDIEAAWAKSVSRGYLTTLTGSSIQFNGSTDLLRDMTPLSGHPNGMTFIAWENTAEVARAQYFSVGGGMVEDEQGVTLATTANTLDPAPFPYKTMAELIALCDREQLTIAELQARNEHLCLRSADRDPIAAKLWDVMSDCIERGTRVRGRVTGWLKGKTASSNALAAPTQQLARRQGSRKRRTTSYGLRYGRQ
jgi:L-serine dehydratase